MLQIGFEKMRYQPINKEFYIKKRLQLIEKLSQTDFVAVVNSNDKMPKSGDQDFKFRQNSDLFYLTGIEQESTILLMFSDKSKPNGYSETLFICEKNPQKEVWTGETLSKEEAKEISGIENILFISEFYSFLSEILYTRNSIFLNLNEYLKYSTQVEVKDLRFVKDMKKRFPLHDFARLNPFISELRLVKEPEEIGQIKKAASITKAAFERVLNFIKPDVYEYEIEAEITHEFIRKAADRHAYPPIIASGKDNCILHYEKNDKKCKSGELILLDFGSEYGGYASDCSRTVPVNGKFTKRQKEVYKSVLYVFKKAVKLIKTGTTIAEINKETELLIQDELIKLKLLTADEIKNNPFASKKYYMHGCSHFMGLDVHDTGTKNTVLQAGNVLTCEPGIYIKEEGFGIRLENDILVTSDGQTDLMSDIPIEAEEIEKIMKNSSNS